LMWNSIEFIYKKNLCKEITKPKTQFGVVVWFFSKNKLF
jgi:hypothetical protein